MSKFTLTRYLGVAERPLVILINHSTTAGEKFDNIDSLKERFNSFNEKLYNVFDNQDLSVWNIDNWNTNRDVDWDKLNKIANQ